MMANSTEIQDLEDLQQHVYQTLCDLNELEVGAFPMNERILVRGGKPCGMYFCLHGPRSVTFTAIWETDRNSVLFYGSTGERMAKAQLTHAPQLAPVAA